MRSLLEVVRHELTQDGHEVLVIQNDDAVEALSPQGADHSLHNCVRFWRVGRAGDGVDTDASGALAKVAAIDGIAIAEQMPWRVPQGVASITCRQTQAAVGLAVTLTWTIRARHER
jgi:hypothetical protein